MIYEDEYVIRERIKNDVEYQSYKQFMNDQKLETAKRNAFKKKLIFMLQVLNCPQQKEVKVNEDGIMIL